MLYSSLLCGVLLLCASSCVLAFSRSWRQADTLPEQCHQGGAYSSTTTSRKDCAMLCAQAYPDCSSVNYRQSDGLCQMFHTAAMESLGACSGQSYMEIIPPILSDTTVDIGTCATGWEQHSNFCYQYQKQPMIFQEAYEHCVSLGANLASIYGFYENKFVASLAPFDTEILLGATKQSGNSMDLKLVWSDASPTDYFYWSDNEPDRMPQPAYCVRIGRENYNAWLDASCYDPATFVCKKPAV